MLLPTISPDLRNREVNGNAIFRDSSSSTAFSTSSEAAGLPYIYTITRTLTNATLSNIVCTSLSMNPNYTQLIITLSLAAERSGLRWLLPECVYDYPAAHNVISLSGLIISEDFAVASLSRISSDCLSLQLRSCVFVNSNPQAASSSAGFAMNWDAFIQAHPSLNTLLIRSSGLVGTLPARLPSSASTFDVSGNQIRGSIPSTLFTSYAPKQTGFLLVFLGENRLSGEIPPNLFTMNTLSATSLTFNASYNSLSGTLPPAIISSASLYGSVVNIQLYLSYNRLTGGLPSRLFAFPTLVSSSSFPVTGFSASVYVDNNLLDGSISDDLFGGKNRGAYLDASQNLLSGSLPASLFNRPDIVGDGNTMLNLQNNRLSGTFPSSTLFTQSRFTGSLLNLLLANNALTGTISSNLFAFTQGPIPSVILDLTSNQLTGTLPSDIFALSNLSTTTADITFSLGYNQISGTFPSQLLNVSAQANIASIRLHAIVLNVTGNAITGSLPSDIMSSATTSYPFAFTLDASFNRMTGSIPPGLLAAQYTIDSQTGSASSPFGRATLDFSSNKIDGTIPSTLLSTPIWAPCAILELRLASNQLEGALPSELFSAPNLVNMQVLSLNLRGNLLSGGIPDKFLAGTASTWYTPSQLVQIDVSQNHLSGAIPINLLTPSDTSTYLASITFNASHNQLSGPLDYRLLRDADAGQLILDLSYNQISGFTSDLLSDIYFRISTLKLTLDNNPLLDVNLADGFFAITSSSGTLALTTLSFSANNAQIQGTFPAGAIGGGVQVLSVSLRNNSLSGSLSLTSLLGTSSLILIALDLGYNPQKGLLSLESTAGAPFGSVTLLVPGNTFNGIFIDSPVPAYLRQLDISGMTTFTAALSSTIFASSTFVSLNASNSGFTGAFPSIGSIDPPLIALDMSGTNMDFCTSAVVWKNEAQSVCALNNTNATSCPDLFPFWCFSKTVATTPACSNATRPQGGTFECLNGVWTSIGNVIIPVLVIPSGTPQTIVNGDLITTEIIIQGSGSSVVITGCATNLTSITIELTTEELSKLSSKTLQLLISYGSQDPSCGNLSSVALNTKLKGKNCKKVSTQKVESAGTISALFTIDSSSCRVWWIVLASVLGGLVLIAVVVVVLLVIFVKPVRTFFRPYSARGRAAKTVA